MFSPISELTLETFKAELSGTALPKVNQTTILEIMKIHNSYFQKQVIAREKSAASLQKYKRATFLLKSFIEKQKAEDVIVADCTSSFVYGLEEYLKYKSCFNNQKGIKNIPVVKYMRMYKTCWQECFLISLNIPKIIFFL